MMLKSARRYFFIGHYGCDLNLQFPASSYFDQRKDSEPSYTQKDLLLTKKNTIYTFSFNE